jgi:protoporphyrin/coproporphyrin ferrochelatase
MERDKSLILPIQKTSHFFTKRQMKNKTPKSGILLVNLGTPDSYQTPDVRKYLREFLMDKRVIDIPFLSRWFLVNFIIAPFRAPKSAAVYKELWQERGSPLLFYGTDLRDELRKMMGSDVAIELGMRYQNPSIESALAKLMQQNISKLIVLPLFPQYASATTGSIIDKCMELMKDWQVLPNILFVDKFFSLPAFINSLSEIARPYLEKADYDFFVFSYHGVPERQILKASRADYCRLNDKCCSVYHQKNEFCYRAQCFENSRLLATSLGIPEDKYAVAFQSRLGKDPWILPYTDDLLKTLPAKGYKKVLAFSPAFVADCLETTIEVGHEFKEMFLDAGGEKWDLVESLNVHPSWVRFLAGYLGELVR